MVLRSDGDMVRGEAQWEVQEKLPWSGDVRGGCGVSPSPGYGLSVPPVEHTLCVYECVCVRPIMQCRTQASNITTTTLNGVAKATCVSRWHVRAARCLCSPALLYC